MPMPKVEVKVDKEGGDGRGEEADNGMYYIGVKGRKVAMSIDVIKIK